MTHLIRCSHHLEDRNIAFSVDLLAGWAFLLAALRLMSPFMEKRVYKPCDARNDSSRACIPNRIHKSILCHFERIQGRENSTRRQCRKDRESHSWSVWPLFVPRVVFPAAQRRRPCCRRTSAHGNILLGACAVISWWCRLCDHLSLLKFEEKWLTFFDGTIKFGQTGSDTLRHKFHETLAFDPFVETSVLTEIVDVVEFM